MKLVKFRVTNFKSIEDSGEIDVDEVTCLVGKNEAGKTALFEALAKLNPVGGIHPKFELEDYPRRNLNAYKKEHEKRPATGVRATFELSEQEMADLDGEFGEGILTSRFVTVSKGYDNVQRWDIPLSEASHVKHLVRQADIPAEFSRKLTEKRTVQQLLDAAKAIDDATDSVKALAQLLESRKTKPLMQEVLQKLSNERLPQFFYFDQYSTLPGTISLSKLKQAQAAGKGGEEEYTSLALIKLVGATIDEFLRQDNYERLKADLEAASNAITDQVFKFWTQNRELEVEFALQPELDANKTMKDTILHIRIENRRHRVTVPFDKRSRGFVWFFSFLVAFSDYKGEGDKVILLLDEPGLSLHAKAQWDLLRFIDDDLAPYHQVLYSTHSPFMITPSKLERVRTVQDVDDHGTLVSNDPLKNDPDTVFPIQAALGYDLAQTLFLGPNTLLVEGSADLVYLNLATIFLEEERRIGLSDKWVIVPVGGADKVATFVSLLGANQLNVAVFLDVSQTDQQRVGNLLKNELMAKRNLVTVGSILGRKNADIEDMFSVGPYLALVNAAYKDALAGSTITTAAIKTGDPRIVKRLERYFADHSINGGRFSHYKPSYVLMRNAALQQKIFDTEAKKNFEAAFAKINGLLK